MNEYTEQEKSENGNYIYGGKRHDLICDELDKSGYSISEIVIASVGIWKGIESERIVKDKIINELDAKLAKAIEALSEAGSDFEKQGLHKQCYKVREALTNIRG